MGRIKNHMQQNRKLRDPISDKKCKVKLEQSKMVLNFYAEQMENTPHVTLTNLPQTEQKNKAILYEVSDSQCCD